MADNRTGLSAADLAAQFRDMCGDGSIEWVYTPMQTWLLLDAADMLDENTKLLMRLNAEHLVRQNVERENTKLRELVRDMAAEMRGLGVDFTRVGWCDYADRMRELGVEV